MFRNYQELLCLSDEEFRSLDPLESNLLVAKSIPSLASLDVLHYQTQRDHWADRVSARLSQVETVFSKTPHKWKNDVSFFRLGVLCEFLERELGIAYREDQRHATQVWYTDPSDLFANGVIDTRRGTCGSMATLYVAIAWRLGWPVSLACLKSHFLCRYDDGKTTYNIDPTVVGWSGFKCDPDDYLMNQHGLPRKAVTSGSDLRALKAREMFGVFVGFRARHMKDTNNLADAEKDYLLARHLFPSSRELYLGATWVIVRRGEELFEPTEPGSPRSLAEAITEYEQHQAFERQIQPHCHFVGF